MELVFMLMNILPIFAVGYASTISTISACNYKCKGMKNIFIIVAAKYFVYNIVSLYCLMYYAELGKYMIFLQIIFVSITVLAYKKYMGDSWNKLFFIAVISDCRSLCCTQGVIYIVYFWGNYDVIKHIDSPPTKYNLIIIALAVLFLRLTGLLGKELYRYIKTLKLKRPGFWVFMLVIYYIAGAYLSTGLKWFFSVKETLLFAIVIFSIVFIFREKKKQLLEISNSYLLLQQNMILQYYESLNEQIELTRKMRHDINNHMQIIKSIRKENDGEGMDTYTKALKEQYEQLDPVYYCNNVVVNALLVNKNKKCQKENISFEADLREVDLGNISEYDFAGIMFNLLDNAIESCLKISDRTRRFIHLHCFTDAGQMLIHVANSCVEKESREKTGLFTSKSDKNRHGVGMRIIGETVKKYGGGMEVKHQEYRFETFINIPVDK